VLFIQTQLWQCGAVNDGSKRAIYAAFGANLGIAVSKFVGAAITGSAGLMAEAVHSAADTGNQALLLVGGKRSERSPNAEFQFGFGRERYFWSFVVALVLFSMGGLFAFYEGIQKLLHPHEATNLGIAIGILVVAIGLETFSLRTAMKEANHVKPKSMSWWRFIKTSKQPELPVVLLEDVGAEVGLLVALAGVLTAHFTHDARWDAAGSLTIGVLLIVIAAVLAIEMKGLLMGEAALPEQQELIERALQDDPRVLSIVHSRTMHLGPDEVLLAAKIDFVNTLSVAQLAQAIDDAEVRARSVVDATLRIYIEPDIRR
jgi:cation diffusion facilitator family transporter